MDLGHIYSNLSAKEFAFGFNLLFPIEANDPQLVRIRNEKESLLQTARNPAIGYIVYRTEFPEGVLTADQLTRFFGTDRILWNGVPILLPDLKLTDEEVQLIKKHSKAA